MTRRYWSGDGIVTLQPNEVFVFGSNAEGRHGKGAAKTAMSFGAVYGQARGIMGQAYAIITKNLTPGTVEKITGRRYPYGGYLSVPLWDIETDIRELYEYARQHSDKDFLIVYQYKPLDDQSNLNGYTTRAMMDVFLRNDPPINIVFHDSYRGQDDHA